MAGAAAGLGVIQYGAQGLGAIYDAQSEKEASKFNERLALENAELAIAQGVQMERRQRIMGRQALGDIKTGYAASGVTMEGSALDILESSAANAELDALTIRYESQMKARSYRHEAKLEKRRRKSIDTMTAFNVLGSAFGAGSKAAG